MKITRKIKNIIKKKFIFIPRRLFNLLGTWDKHDKGMCNLTYLSDREFINPFSDCIYAVNNHKGTYLPRDVIYSLDNVYGYRTVLLSCENKIITDVLKWKYRIKRDTLNIRWHHLMICMFRKICRLQKPFYENVVYITPNIYRNYYHFIVDVLFRMHGYMKIEDLYGMKPTFIATEPLQEFHKQYLDILGINVVCSKCFYTNRLFVSGRRRISFFHSSQAIIDFRNDIYKRMHILTPCRDRLIYISRQKAKDRRVKNEEELMRLLSLHGFKRYFLEDMSVRAQIKLFSEAKIVISPHGAGVVNMIYNIHPVLIELFPHFNQGQGGYENLVNSMGGIYRAIIGIPTQGTDFIVPIDKIESHLQEDNI